MGAEIWRLYEVKIKTQGPHDSVLRPLFQLATRPGLVQVLPSCWKSAIVCTTLEVAM